MLTSRNNCDQNRLRQCQVYFSVLILCSWMPAWLVGQIFLIKKWHYKNHIWHCNYWFSKKIKSSLAMSPMHLCYSTMPTNVAKVFLSFFNVVFLIHCALCKTESCICVILGPFMLLMSICLLYYNLFFSLYSMCLILSLDLKYNVATAKKHLQLIPLWEWTWCYNASLQARKHFKSSAPFYSHWHIFLRPDNSVCVSVVSSIKYAVTSYPFSKWDKV